MEAELLKTLGQALGMGGVALGIFFLLYRELIRKVIFPKLDKRDAYRFLRLLSVLIWSVAIFGIGAWIFGDQKVRTQQSSISTMGPQSPVVQDTKGNVQMEFGTPPSAPK